eukprot:6802554-Karenia_brevis.AAC.1
MRRLAIMLSIWHNKRGRHLLVLPSTCCQQQKRAKEEGVVNVVRGMNVNQEWDAIGRNSKLM